VLADLASSPEPNGWSRSDGEVDQRVQCAGDASGDRTVPGRRGNMARTRAPREDDYRFRCTGKDVTLADIRRQLLDDPACDARVLFALCRLRWV
jgi:hypothetical protein